MVKTLIECARREDMMEDDKSSGFGAYWEIIECTPATVFFDAFGPDAPVTKTNAKKVVEALETGMRLIQVGEQSTAGLDRDLTGLLEAVKEANKYALRANYRSEMRTDIERLCA